MTSVIERLLTDYDRDLSEDFNFARLAEPAAEDKVDLPEDPASPSRLQEDALMAERNLQDELELQRMLQEDVDSEVEANEHLAAEAAENAWYAEQLLAAEAAEQAAEQAAEPVMPQHLSRLQSLICLGGFTRRRMIPECLHRLHQSLRPGVVQGQCHRRLPCLLCLRLQFNLMLQCHLKLQCHLRLCHLRLQLCHLRLRHLRLRLCHLRLCHLRLCRLRRNSNWRPPEQQRSIGTP